VSRPPTPRAAGLLSTILEDEPPRFLRRLLHLRMEPI
jgi:hypothetical protein